MIDSNCFSPVKNDSKNTKLFVLWHNFFVSQTWYEENAAHTMCIHRINLNSTYFISIIQIRRIIRMPVTCYLFLVNHLSFIIFSNHFTATVRIHRQIYFTNRRCVAWVCKWLECCILSNKSLSCLQYTTFGFRPEN